MSMLKVDFNKPGGRIKPMHGVGQPPLLGVKTEYFHYLPDADIPYSRLHDVGGWFGGNMFVDIPNIFRNFDADENDPASYDFAFTDLVISALEENHCEPIFRLGVTIENFHRIKFYRISPPSDPEKWARICEHIIRHYNEGWADGFHYNIQYWEIWNEPDNYAMWKGTAKEYFDLYRVTSRHLRKCFGDSIKIGGYASSGFHAVVNDKISGSTAIDSSIELSEWEKRTITFVEFFKAFIDMVTREQLPLDFFSHHSYASVEEALKMQLFVEKYLAQAGLSDVEIHLNEWNPNPQTDQRGKSIASANAAAMMCAMQNTKMELMCYYDARIGTSVYGGLFHPMTYKPLCTYYAFQAFGKLYKLGTQAEAVCDNSSIYTLAASNGDKRGVIIANIGEDTLLTTNLDKGFTAYQIDEEKLMEKVSVDPQKFNCKSNTVYYFE